jgi:hypothetical protein
MFCLFVRYMALGIALRYVLEALKKPHNTKMYIFGIAALDRFKTRWVQKIECTKMNFSIVQKYSF